jgi:hypothetical protein
MMQNYPWAKALQIPSHMLTEWKTLQPPDISFTFFCLKTGRIGVAKYLEWAKEHYGIAVLNEEYFNLEPNLNFWTQIQTVANWSPSLLPLESWDGTIFIGCVEPQLETRWSFPVVYVLADPNDLEKLWNRYSPGLPVEKPEPSNALSYEPANEFSDKLINARSSAPPKLEPKVTALKLPADNVDDKTAVTSLTLAFDLQIPTPRQNESSDIEMPEGLTVSIPNPLPANDFMLPIDLKATSEAADEGLAGPDEPTAIFRSAAVTPPVPVQANFSTSNDMSTAKASTSANIVADLTSAGTIVSGPTDPNLAPAKLEDATDIDSTVAWAFRELKMHFSSCLLFGYNSNGLVAWKWEPSLRPTARAGAISFDSPSLFRVVARTLRPYHGFVVDNPIHKKFFESWGMKTYPPHVTAVPVVIHGTLQGLFFCISNDKRRSVDSLQFAEMIADLTIQRLEALHIQLAA